MNIDELLHILNKYKIIIYGTGYAAHNFYTALILRKMEDRVICFMKTNVSKEESVFCSKNVISIDEVEKVDLDTIICLAVHETNYKEIEKTLLSKDIKQYIWVHPYIFELALGKMVKKAVPVSVKKILYSQQRNNYLIAIRYLAIESYFNKNDYGFEIYKKAMKMQCEAGTVEKRIASFKNLIKAWNKEGYRKEYPILIDEELRLIDGTHRFSIALYNKQKEILCNILPASVNYETIAKDTDSMPEKLLKPAGFTDQEIELIKRKQEILWRCENDEYK